MRVLVTGMTAKQRGAGRPALFMLLDGVTRALEHAGHEVVGRGRRLTMDEDLSGIDLAVVAIYDYRSLSSIPQKYHCLRACLELPHVLAWDDWNAKDIFYSVKRGADPECSWRDGPFEDDAKHMEDRAEFFARYAEPAAELVDSWAEEIPRCICPAFGWGRHEVLRAQHRFDSLLPWDPSPWVKGVYSSPGADLYDQVVERTRTWALASLTQQSEWVSSLGLTWPVDRMYRPEANARGWQVTEEEVFRRYHVAYGALSPPYKNLLGSGWWRNRFNLATQAGAVLCCDPREVAPLDRSYFYVEPAAVEQLSDAELRLLAEDQRDEMRDHWMPTEDRSAQELVCYLEAAACLGTTR